MEQFKFGVIKFVKLVGALYCAMPIILAVGFLFYAFAEDDF